MKRKLLIIAPYQFGELSDCFYWAKYATLRGWNVTYLGYKYKERAIKQRTFPGVTVKKVMHYDNRIILGIVFYLKCILEILLHNHRNVIICRMPMCQLLPKLFPRRNIILDVRTLSVSKDATIRNQADDALISLKKEFKRCTVISEGVGEKIGYPYNLLPLGAEPLSKRLKCFDRIRLFYIGTYNNRELSTFIEGMALYQQKMGDNISLDLVGGGTPEECQKVRDSIESCQVKNVCIHGYLTHDEAIKYFDECNVGVCFVPVTEYYQHQPPTKLYEYLLSGMIVISTNTISNLAVMNTDNGVVVEDNAQSVCDGLVRMRACMNTYDSARIIASAQQYHWEHIVSCSLLPLMS